MRNANKNNKLHEISKRKTVSFKVSSFLKNKINNEQVRGKTLMEAVNLMRGPVGSPIEITIRRKNLKMLI